MNYLNTESSYSAEQQSDVMNETPNKNNSITDILENYSPLFSQWSVPEISQNIDVIWDWHSPKSNPHKPIKRSVLQQQAIPPKEPIKRHRSNNQIQSFSRLQKELETLLPKSNSFENALNDSMDEQLCLYTQQIEHGHNRVSPKQALPLTKSIENDSLKRCVNKHNIEDLLNSKGDNKIVIKERVLQTRSTETITKIQLEQIEQNRLEALRKLQTKRTLKIIEQNRQLALKRLELNKKKRSLLLQKKH